jgi:hypothetical protein
MLMRTPAGCDAPLTRVLAPRGARLSTLREAGAYLSTPASKSSSNGALLIHRIAPDHQPTDRSAPKPEY